MQIGIAIGDLAGVTWIAVNGRVRFGDDKTKTVVGAVVSDRGGVGGLILIAEVSGCPLMVSEGPNNISR